MKLLHTLTILTLLSATTKTADAIKLPTLLKIGATAAGAAFLYKTYTDKQSLTSSSALTLKPAGAPKTTALLLAPSGAPRPLPIVLAINPEAPALTADVHRHLVANPDHIDRPIDEEGNTLLHKAVLSGNFELVKTLVRRYGADAEICNIHGQTPLAYAASHGHQEVVKLLMPKSER